MDKICKKLQKKGQQSRVDTTEKTNANIRAAKTEQTHLQHSQSTPQEK